MASSARHDPAALTSWKEIASYLGKGVRTVQRWEAQLGLPVRRPNHRDRGIIFAHREELDAWLNKTWHAKSGPKNDVQGANGGRARVADGSHMLTAQTLRMRHHQLVTDLHLQMNRMTVEFQALVKTLACDRGTDDRGTEKL